MSTIIGTHLCTHLCYELFGGIALKNHTFSYFFSITQDSYADDLQLQMSAPTDKISELLHSMHSCISDVIAWATAKMPKLNDKTELMLATSKRSKHLSNVPTSITIGNAQIH